MTVGGGQPGGSTASGGDSEFEEFVDPVDGVRWRVDLSFLESNWTCTWGNGCSGILDEPAEHLQQGCCSVGAELLDDEEARTVAALGLSLNPERFQFHTEALDGGVFAEASRRSTRVVDGACIFLNRPGFAGGAGCALHLGAVDDGERPMDWKPSVCWQLPLKVETGDPAAPGCHDDGSPIPVRTLRRWHRSDWGGGGTTMAWCCTERDGQPATATSSAASAYVGDRPVAHSLFDEIVGLVGPDVAVRIRSRVDDRRAQDE